MEPKYIEIVNSDNFNIIDTYNVHFNSEQFNVNKFVELIKCNGISLDKEFVFKHIHYGELHTKTPLFYPCSTLLLASALGVEKARELTIKTTNDNMLADYVSDMIKVYNPMDFHSVYNLVKKDDRLSYVPNDTLLEDILSEKDMDLVHFSKIFRHIAFEYTGSVDAAFIKKYLEHLRSNPNGGILPRFIEHDYTRYNIANENRKVLKLLNLTPNIIN
ncbi:MAG: hypothetical protein J5970_04970 [Bacilli bacterium]|nr:hypothetical protein [Bacilli bacterium]MBP3259459.1 hypothetical protein [Bacilli bacterium]